MKKTLTAIALASALPQLANALPLVDIYAGAYSWQQNYSGNVVATGEELDIKDDVGLDSNAGGVYYFAIDHAIPVLPNIKLKQTNLMTDGSGNKTFNFGGVNINGTFDSEADFSHTDLTLYWGLPLPIVDIDFGLTARNFSGKVKFEETSGLTPETTEEKLDVTIPMLYGHVGVDIPMTGLSVSGEVNYIGVKNSGITDYDLNLTYVLPVIPVLDVGISAGYRSFNMKVDPEDFGGKKDDLSMDASVAGPYLGLSLHL